MVDGLGLLQSGVVLAAESGESLATVLVDDALDLRRAHGPRRRHTDAEIDVVCQPEGTPRSCLSTAHGTHTAIRAQYGDDTPSDDENHSVPKDEEFKKRRTALGVLALRPVVPKPHSPHGLHLSDGRQRSVAA